MHIDKVIVGPITYTIEEVLGLFALPDENEYEQPLLGECQQGKALIRLEEDQRDTVKYITLWHEIIHAILCGAGLADHDEQIVNAIAHGIVDVLERNPDL